MKSMTGFGKADFLNENVSIHTEIKSVNNRYLDIQFNLPLDLKPIEHELRQIVKNSLKRGRIDCYIKIRRYDNEKRKINLNRQLIEQFIHDVDDLNALYDIKADVKLDHLLRIPDIFEYENGSGDLPDWLKDASVSAIGEALEKLELLRVREGERLQKEFENELEQFKLYLKKIEAVAQEVNKSLYEKCRENMLTYLEEVNVDENRIIQEAAYASERSDISEELARLRSHSDAFEKALKQSGPLGKRLDFLLQEMNREVNTLNAKTASLEINKTGVELKLIIEKLREQAQNIE